MIYQYRIGKNKLLSYNATPAFRCPKALEEMKDKSKERITIEGYGGQHSELVWNGKNTRKVLINTREETPEGTIKTFRELIYKATKKTPPICKCGEPMVLRYPAWYEYKDPKAKTMNMGVFGNARMGTKRDKRYWTKFFRTRKARDKFINSFLTKHRKN